MPQQILHRGPGVRRLVEELRRRISTGELKPGDYLPSAHELAQEFAVGSASVIRVYRTLTAAGLIATVRGRGAFVKEPVRVGVTEVVAVLPSPDDLSQLRNPDCDWVFHGLLEGMNSATLRLGVRLQLLFASAVSDRWAEVVDNWREGTVALFVGSVPPEAALRLVRQGRTFALVLPAGQRQTAWEQELPVVMADYRGGVRAAVANVLAAGRRRTAFLGDPESQHEYPRYRGFLDAVEAAGCGVPLLIPCRAISRDAGRHAMAGHLAAAKGQGVMDFLFCGNDLRALGALDAMAAQGLRVPEQVAVLGFDDIAAGAVAGLSSVRLPIRELGERGLEWCVANAANRGQATLSGVPPVLELPCPAVWRTSTVTG